MANERSRLSLPQPECLQQGVLLRARAAQAFEAEGAHDDRMGNVLGHALVAEVVLVQAIAGHQIPFSCLFDEAHGLKPTHQWHVLG